MSEKFKEVISPSQIDLKQEIKKVGNYTLSINFHPEVVAELQVVVEKKQDKINLFHSPLQKVNNFLFFKYQRCQLNYFNGKSQSNTI